MAWALLTYAISQKSNAPNELLINIQVACKYDQTTILFDSENEHAHVASRMPNDVDLAATVKWIKQALAGEVAILHPILNQLACCLFASGYTKDMYQAKAIAAMSAGGLVAA